VPAGDEAAASVVDESTPGFSAVCALGSVVALLCVRGLPPGVDLAAHAAQAKTLASWVAGDALIRAHFTAQFIPGYGLLQWMVLPLTWATNGAVAIRIVLALVIATFLPILGWLLRKAGRSPWMAVVGLPFLFNVSYWYGFLPELTARALAMATLGAWLWSLSSERRSVRVLTAILASLVVLSHLLVGAVLALVVAALTAFSPRFSSRWRRTLVDLAPSLLLLGWAALASFLAQGASAPPAIDWNWWAHTGFLFRNFGREGRLGTFCALGIALTLVAAALLQRRRSPAWIPLLTLSVAFAAIPQTVGRIFLICIRFPSLIGLAALFLIDFRKLGVVPKVLLLSLSMVATFEAVSFHLWFRGYTDGLPAVLVSQPLHGYLSTEGKHPPNLRLPYLEHLGEWVTGEVGGLGHHLFADAAQQPIQYRPGQERSGDALLWSAAQLQSLETLYLFGEGSLPASLGPRCLEAQALRWRRFGRCRVGARLTQEPGADGLAGSSRPDAFRSPGMVLLNEMDARAKLHHFQVRQIRSAPGHHWPRYEHARLHREEQLGQR